MALPGYPIKVYAKASNAAVAGSDEIAGLNDATYDEMADLFDVTSFKTASASAWRARLTGLNDGSIDLSGDFEPADAPQALLRSSKRSGASVWLSIYFNPSAGASVFKGYQVECKVEKFNVKDSVSGKTEFSASLKFTAAPVDVTG
jgi:predicted secreted protein